MQRCAALLKRHHRVGALPRPRRNFFFLRCLFASLSRPKRRGRRFLSHSPSDINAPSTPRLFRLPLGRSLFSESPLSCSRSSAPSLRSESSFPLYTIRRRSVFFSVVGSSVRFEDGRRFSSSSCNLERKKTKTNPKRKKRHFRPCSPSPSSFPPSSSFSFHSSVSRYSSSFSARKTKCRSKIL